MKLRPLLLVIALFVSACGPGGDDLLDTFIDAVLDEPPLSESDDPGIRAAGSTVEDQDNEERANTQISRALKPDKTADERVRHAENAILARPGDPLYYVYLAWFQAAGGLGQLGTVSDNLTLAMGLVSQQFAHISDSERRQRETDRRMLELTMEVVLAQIMAEPEGSSDRRRYTQSYCNYRDRYRESDYMADSLAGQAQWDFVINHGLCTDS